MEMITETARSERQAVGRQWKWARVPGRLAVVLAMLGAGALLFALLVTVSAKLWGYETYVIYGSSMEPTIKVGSLIAAKPANVDDLQVGDIVVFLSPGNGMTITHRIVGIHEEGGQRQFETKGDASNGADPLKVSLEDGTQQVIYDLPYLGYIVHFAGSSIGIILLVALPALGLLALQLTQRRKGASDAEVPREG
jgi:signal peptidase